MRIGPDVRLPQPLTVEALAAVILFLQAMSRTSGDVVWTSWWRTAAQNAAAGGHPESQHLRGTAIDLTGRDAERVGMHWAALGGVFLPESDHVHLQLYRSGQ